MNLENKLKKKFLFSNKNVVKYLYLWFNKFFSSFKYRKSYSQGAMDLILKDIFRNKKKGIYIDVGCQHPIQNNNTYQLHRKGWEGINIDLDKFNIDLFNFNRPKDFNINQAISDKIGHDKLYFYHEKSPINTLDAKISKLQKASVKDIVEISTDTLTNIVEKSPYHEIDLLSVDVEGYELKVLKGLDFNKFNPKIIIIEFLDIKSKKWEIPYNNFENIQNSDIYKFLINKNYKFVNWVNGDLVFVSNYF